MPSQILLAREAAGERMQPRQKRRLAVPVQVSIDDLVASTADRGRVQELADDEGIVVCARRGVFGNLIHLDSSLAGEARAVVDMTADD